jgi:hypothetical protein
VPCSNRISFVHEITHDRFKTKFFTTTISKSTPSCRCFSLACFQCGCLVSVMLFFTVVTAGFISCTNQKRFVHGTRTWQFQPLIETKMLHETNFRIGCKCCCPTTLGHYQIVTVHGRGLLFFVGAGFTPARGSSGIREQIAGGSKPRPYEKQA